MGKYRGMSPAPVSAQRIKRLREYRASSLYAAIKRARLEAAREFWTVDALGQPTLLQESATAGVRLPVAPSVDAGPQSTSPDRRP